jgi:hypothetical protein
MGEGARRDNRGSPRKKSMRHGILVLFLLALWTPTRSLAQGSDEEVATASLETFADHLFAEMSGGVFDGLRASEETVSVFDVDDQGRAFLAMGSAWNARLEALVASLTASGLAVRYDVTRRVCHAGPTLGYCTIQYTSTAETPSGPLQAAWSLTLVAQNREAAWQIVHLHNSPGH